MPKRRAHGEGGLYQRDSDGRWVGALPAALSPTGRRRVVYGRTKADALAKLEALKADARTGTLAAPNTLTVAELLREYLRTVQVAGRTRNTHTTYERAARLHLVPTLGHVRLAALTPAHLTRAYHALLTRGRQRGAARRGPGLAPTTVAMAHACLHGALAMAVRWRYVGRNVAADVAPPRRDHAEVATLDAAALVAFLTGAAAAGDPHAAAWYLAADTGMRRAELAALRWDDLALAGAPGSKPQVAVRRILDAIVAGEPVYKDPKTPRSRRRLTISPTTANVLAAHRARQAAARAADPHWRDRGLVFPGPHGAPLSGDALYRRFKRAAARAGLPAGLRLHSLRHTMASLLLAGGASVDSVSRRLGHAASTITLGVYAHAVASSEEAAAAVMARILDGGSAADPPPAAPPIDLAARRRAGG